MDALIITGDAIGLAVDPTPRARGRVQGRVVFSSAALVAQSLNCSQSVGLTVAAVMRRGLELRRRPVNPYFQWDWTRLLDGN